MKTMVGYFYIDSVSGIYEGDLYTDQEQGLISLNNWQSPKLTDIHIKYAVGKKAVDELYDYHLEWKGKTVDNRIERFAKIIDIINGKEDGEA